MSSIAVKRTLAPSSSSKPAGTTIHDAIDLTSEDELSRTPQILAATPSLFTTPKNKWNSSQRTWLFFVVRRYENSWADVAKLFNYAFQAHLSKMGFNKDFPKDSIASQFREGPRKQGSDFTHVYSTPFEGLERKFDRTLASVLQAASRQAIRLIIRSQDDWLSNYTMATPTKRKRRTSFTTDSDDEEVHMQDTEDEEDSSQRKRPHKALRNVVQSFPRIPLTKQAFITTMESASTRQLPNPPSSIDTTPTSSRSSGSRAEASSAHKRPKDILGGLPTHDGLPRLLFRAWDDNSHGENTSHGFASGLQLDDEHPLEEDDPRFLQYAEDHIWRRRIDSPLISLTASFPSAKKKASEKASHESMSVTKEDIKITILHADTVANHTRLYHAKPTIETLAKQKRLPYRYYGRFEFWAWQEAGADTILGQTTLADLEEWIVKDDYLGRLFSTYDLSRCSIKTFRKRCEESGVQLDEEFARSVASLAKLFRPGTSYSQPFLKDFVRTMIQNLDLSSDLDSCFHDISFCAALKETLQASSQIPHRTKKTLATHVSSRAKESGNVSCTQDIHQSQSAIRSPHTSITTTFDREWSTTSSLFQDLADTRRCNQSKRAISEEEDDDITAKAESEINDDVVNLDKDEQWISTPPTDSKADCLLRRFARLTTPSTPSPNHNRAGEVIVIEDDDDDMDAPYDITEARGLLDLFRRPITPPQPPHGHITQAGFTTPKPAALLQSPYESERGSRVRNGLESPSSPLASRKPEVRRTFQIPPIVIATTVAAAALHNAVTFRRVANEVVSKKQKFSIITAADRDAAMQG